MGALRSDKLARYVELVGDPAFLELICQRMGCGESLSAITRSLDVPYSKVMYWLMADVERYAVYERALVALSRFEVDEAKEIADEAVGADEAHQVSAAKLRVDTRFKRARHHAPKEYGETQSALAQGQVKVVLVNFVQDAGGRVIEAEEPAKMVAVKVQDTAVNPQGE